MPTSPLRLSQGGEAPKRRAVMDPDWFQQNSTHFYIITASVLLCIILICAYFLWRGPHRRKFPCFPARRSSSSTPSSPLPDLHRTTTSHSTTSEKQSEAKPKGANTDWTNASRTSKVLLADLELIWEGKRRNQGSRKITKPRPKSPSTPVSAHTFGHGRSPTSAAHTLSTAPTTSSFGHTPDQASHPDVPALPSTPGVQTPESVIAFTATYPQPSSSLSRSIYDPSPRTPHTPYSPPSAYPATPPTAYIPSRSHNDSSISLSDPPAQYATSASGEKTKAVFQPWRRSGVEYISAPSASPGYQPVFDFSRPPAENDYSPHRQTAFSTASVYSQATIPLPRAPQAYPQPGLATALPEIQPSSPFTPFPSTPTPARPSYSPTPSLLLESAESTPAHRRSAHTPPQSILRKSIDSTSSGSRKSCSSTSSTPPPPLAVPTPTAEAPAISVTAPQLARVKRASYAASRRSTMSTKPPPSPLRQLVA